MQHRLTITDPQGVSPEAGRRILQPVSEIFAVTAIPLAAIWIVPLIIHDRAAMGRTIGVLALLGLLTAAAINFCHREGPWQIGFRFDNFREAALLLLRITAIGTAFLLSVGWSLDSIHFGRRFFNQVLILPLWGLQQQYGVQAIINRRWQTIFGKGRRSILLTAAAFSALHLPNPVLVAATFIAGLAWAAVYQKIPNLPALALSHGVLSAVLSNSFPVWLLPNMKVGWGYW